MQTYLRLVVLCCFMITSVSTFAVGYREGEPPTLAAPVEPEQDNSPLINAFASRYKAHGRPRIALFWNREQTDVLVRQKEKVSSSTQRLSMTETEDVVSDNEGTHKLNDFDGLNESVTKQTETEHDDNHRSGLNEKGDVILRSVFRDVLASAGVRLVDRNMMLRTAAAKENSVDPQFSETKGLLGKADWLMELVFIKDKNTPLGYGFRVSVKDIKNSTVLVEFYTQANPPLPGEQPFIAVPGEGFKQAPPPQPGIHDIGYQLALEVMTELSRSL